MNVLDYVRNHITLLDGAMGTMLQNSGLKPGQLPERLNVSSPRTIIDIHRAYFNAGANIISTNTFGANKLHYNETELDEIISAAMKNAQTAVKESASPQEKFIAFDVGPTGKMLAPYGDLPFENAVSIFSESIKLGEKYGADLIFIETMNDLYETKAALLAAKETTSLPVFVSNAYGADGKLLTGAVPAVTVALLESMGADVIGVNCSLGPEALEPVVREYLDHASVPVLVKPNAGLPREENGATVYDVAPASFSESIKKMMEKGVRLAGGCCGTTPAYISALKTAVPHITPLPIIPKTETVITSFAKAVELKKKPVLIGERINPTGKKRFQQALREHDIPFILNEAVKQEDAGASVLDVNVGLPDLEETTLLRDVILSLQTVTCLPLQIDTADPAAMERALRIYNGKAMINSVNGKQKVMDAVFPLAKKYGGVIVALTLDENGIPETAEERLAVAEKILACAKKYGIAKKDVLFDPLAMTVSAAPDAAKTTLKAIRLITEKTGCGTILGVSNVSFGLPSRATLNAAFLTLAMHSGLSAAIVNPESHEIMSAYHAYLALSENDRNFTVYTAFALRMQASLSTEKTAQTNETNLKTAILKGLGQTAAKCVETLLKEKTGLEIINTQIIPALNEIGVAFEKKKVFLPQLLMSAESAAAAFEIIKKQDLRTGEGAVKRCEIVLLTVQGDIHDIGKNIVKLLLENYGFQVTDLGKDVSPAQALKVVKQHHAPLVGLSALMTTTVPAMRETVALLHREAPWCKIIVGGAVLTQEYADMIGADKYAPDAMETVRYADKVDKSLNKERK